MNAAVKRTVGTTGVVETISGSSVNSRQDNKGRTLRVLCATDFSAESEHAFERAILLSRQTGAQLLFLHVVDERQSLRMIGRRADRAHSELQWQLRQQLRQLSHSNSRVAEVTVRVGKPWRTIALAAKEWQADIVVLGAYRRRVAERFFGTTAERVARETGCSVLTVNCAPQTPYHSVLLAADLSLGFASMVRMTQEFGLLDQAKATIVHEFGTSGAPTPCFASELTKRLEYAGLDASQFEFLEKQGRPLDAIARAAARTRAELVVVGLSRYARFRRALGTTVSNQSLRQIGSDVLTVPPRAVQRSMAPQSDTDERKVQGGWFAALQSRSLVVFKVWQSDREHDSGSPKEAQA